MKTCRTGLRSWEVIFDLASKQVEIEKLEQKTAAPGFWDDPQQAQWVLQELNQLKSAIEPWRELETKVEDLKVLAELAEEESSEQDIRELERELHDVKRQFHQLELSAVSEKPTVRKALTVATNPKSKIQNQPTLPSKLTPSSFCASTANSMGSSRKTCLQKPLTIIETASSCDIPRCRQ